MHSQNICHRDISLENILMGKTGSLKISDFGVATVMKPFFERNPNRPGKYQYMSPEVFIGMV